MGPTLRPAHRSACFRPRRLCRCWHQWPSGCLRQSPERQHHRRLCCLGKIAVSQDPTDSRSPRPTLSDYVSDVACPVRGVPWSAIPDIIDVDRGASDHSAGAPRQPRRAITPHARKSIFLHFPILRPTRNETLPLRISDSIDCDQRRVSGGTDDTIIKNKYESEP